jgi:hypothetical protein
VSAKGGLEVNGGIIGRLEAAIRVGSTVSVRFIDYCNFSSDADITVGSEILQSRIYTKGRVTMGEGSTIISSTVHSFHSVSAAAITNPAGKGSAFYLGMDFRLRDAVNESRQRLGVLTRKRDQVKILLDMAVENQRRDMEETYERFEARRLSEEGKLAKLLERFYLDPKAELQVSGEIARGTRIEICEAVLVLPGSMREMTFRLSENGKYIVMDGDAIKESTKRLRMLFGRRRTKKSDE